MIQEKFKSLYKSHQEAMDASLSNEANLECLERISREILKAFKGGKKLMLAGNGGSAADSQHIAAEFIGRFKRERRSLPSIALTTDTSILTAVGNDYGYEDIFSRQIEGLGVEGDVFIGISTSGNSANILKAVNVAKEKGIVTVGLTGRKGGALKDVVDICFHAQTDYTPNIQEVHIMVLHAVSEVVEDVFFGA